MYLRLYFMVYSNGKPRVYIGVDIRVYLGVDLRVHGRSVVDPD